MEESIKDSGETERDMEMVSFTIPDKSFGKKEYGLMM